MENSTTFNAHNFFASEDFVTVIYNFDDAIYLDIQHTDWQRTNDSSAPQFILTNVSCGVAFVYPENLKRRWVIINFVKISAHDKER
ncbi:hypothetical protein DPMN_004845 [Dreissena polymorpha]|uniref:Uncharacterized protein n=1 Tax=Dreissena polymorpha TaxID=45954 RepID=A0A9D4MP78_DREPO|nr:hypothetical protein DPMN_004845 [Dreissena polymorpha]